MKLYIAGPDVFRPDARDWAAGVHTLCRAAGHEALIPLDGDATTASEIYASNIAMIAAADVVLANLDPFRGAEPDSGTAFEVGYALALGKRVIAYVSSGALQAERVSAWQGHPLVQGENGLQDAAGRLVENFGLPLNLMLAVPARIVVGGLTEALAAL
ncbi:nucleoside 2-deoxyribosyltransferase [Viridibacterium curvum]|uniref:Nucleoside 2-deoxyribosyltransferase n=1 Tax=Viridibacterium curvum TaxID=1101404 RepID=A0ABP9R0N3_9RHOO